MFSVMSVTDVRDASVRLGLGYVETGVSADGMYGDGRPARLP